MPIFRCPPRWRKLWRVFFVCRTSPAAIIRIPHGNCQRASPLSLKLLDCRIYERRTPRCRGNSRPCQDEVGVFGQLASLYCKSLPCPPDPSTKMLTSLMRPLNKKWRDILPRLGRNVYMTSPLTLHHIRRWFMFEIAAPPAICGRARRRCGSRRRFCCGPSRSGGRKCRG